MLVLVKAPGQLLLLLSLLIIDSEKYHRDDFGRRFAALMKTGSVW